MRSTPMGPRPIRAPEKKRRSAFAVMLNLRADQAKGACDVFDVAREIALEWVREKGHVVAPEDDTRDFVSEDGAVHLHQRGGSLGCWRFGLSILMSSPNLPRATTGSELQVGSGSSMCCFGRRTLGRPTRP